jgi:hypothetical protein
MGLGLDVVPLKKPQHPEVGLGIYIPGFQGDERLEFVNSQVRATLVQVLLCQLSMLRDLILLGEERNG